MKFPPIVALFLLLGGCRAKSYESFTSATTPAEFGPAQGDPYTNGGIAAANGGLNVKTRYGAGAKASGQPATGYDEPAKGSGLQPGEEPASGKPWWATQNSPISQARPGAIDANGTRVKN